MPFREADRRIHRYLRCPGDSPAHTHRGEQLRQVLQRDEEEAGSTREEDREGEMEGSGGGGEETRTRRSRRRDEDEEEGEKVH